jgi:hypothetical protein
VSEQQRQLLLTSTAVLLLLFVTAMGDAWLAMVAAGLMLAIAFVVLPRERARGGLAALVAVAVAAVVVAFVR